jgi:hypothetical protein
MLELPSDKCLNRCIQPAGVIAEQKDEGGPSHFSA